MTTPSISVVVVSWNSAESLPTSLAALRRSATIAGADLEIVVIDNASTDGSPGVAAAAGVDRVVENPVNAGYVAAASQGIALSRADWLMLANPDLTVDPEFFGAMLDAARDAEPDVACLAPDIRYAANRSVVNSRGIEVDAIGIPAERDAGAPPLVLTGPTDVFGPSTSGCLIRRAALAEVGGLEPLYFAYLEDVDVAWRLRKRGYRTLIVPGSIALHEGSVSVGEGSWLKAFLVARNRRLLFRMHGPPDLRSRVLRGVTELGHATVQALSGSGTASIRGRVAALRARRYTAFLSTASRGARVPDVEVALGPRQTLRDALRRKRAAAALMSPVDRTRTTVPLRVREAPASVDERQTRPLRVLVDAANLKPGQGGIRTYTMGLIQALAGDPDLRLIVAASLDDVTDLGPMEFVPISPRTQGIVTRALWRELRLSSLARALDVDVALSPVPELPLTTLPVPSVIVVHDVGPLAEPDFYSLPKRLRYRAFLPRTCRLASAIVCVSQTTRAGLFASAAVDPGRCHVIGEGPQLLGSAPKGPQRNRPFILYVGSLDPRKNVDTLLDAFAQVDPSTAAQLVLVGPTERRTSDMLARRVVRLGLEDRVQHLGYVDTSELTALYRDALAVVLPSLYEGFGLPILEAMKSGTPVVASEIPAVREVARDAALYVSRPLDVTSWREALVRVSTDPKLRQDLAARGIEMSERFSWFNVAEAFSALLRRVADGDASTRPPLESLGIEMSSAGGLREQTRRFTEARE